MKKIKLIDINKLEFEVIQDIFKGEKIIFNTQETDIFEKISNQIEEIKTKIKKEEINKEVELKTGQLKLEIQSKIYEISDLKNRIDSLKKEHESEIKEERSKLFETKEYLDLKGTNESLKKEYLILETKIKQNKANIINEFKNSDEYLKQIDDKKLLEVEKKGLEKRIKELNESFEIKLKETEKRAIDNFKLNDKEYKEIQIQKIKNEEEIKNLKEKIKQNEEIAENNIKNAKDLAILEFKKSSEWIEKVSEIDKLRKENDEIQKARTGNSKLIGENLENWIFEKYEKEYENKIINNFSFIMEKTNKTVDNKKPDFILKYYNANKELHESIQENDEPILNVVIEAKTEDINTKNGSTNQSFLKKLEIDRKNFKAEYALLVTELEREDDFEIKRFIEYPNIFVIRPAFLTMFIDLFIYIAKIESKKLETTKMAEISFKTKQEFNSELEKRKDDVLKVAEDTVKKLQEIDVQTSNIIKAANKIDESNRIAKERITKTLTNKLNEITFRKIENEIDAKIEDVQEAIISKEDEE